MTTYQNLLEIVDSLPQGVTPKVTKLPRGKATHTFANRIRGGSSRVRTGYGSRSVNGSTLNTGLQDVQ